jgi:hypothetical protein
MNWKEKIIKEYGLSFHVKDILVFEEFDIAKRTIIPFLPTAIPV